MHLWNTIMKFPTLEKMIEYGIYTVKDLVLYSQGRLVKRNVKISNECERCNYVHSDTPCLNCTR